MHRLISAAVAIASISVAGCSAKLPDAATVRDSVVKFFASARPQVHYEIGAVDNLKCAELKDSKSVGCRFDLTVTDKDAALTRTSQGYIAYGPDGGVITDASYPWNFETLIAAEKAMTADPQFAAIRYNRVETSCSRSDDGVGLFCLVVLHFPNGSTAADSTSFGSTLILKDGHWVLTPGSAKFTGEWRKSNLKVAFDKTAAQVTMPGEMPTAFDWKFGDKGEDPDSGVVMMQRRAQGTIGGGTTNPPGPIFSCYYRFWLVRLVLSNCRYAELNGTYYKSQDF
ncbi:exported hypothetical protein [Mesorhizobium plurifarium]|uniref:Lipoprotein n=1 Tax=Mesorhizobium plurifarium TaxID=69974 RepID=A0A090DWD8_MESPL|nr:exported hypothetical protein [Mesorhizobium plurifarium]